jgi:hypothetical protein
MRFYRSMSSIGGVCAGYLASGGCALGWLGAVGGGAVAQVYAVGGAALGQHANDAAAVAFAQQNTFLRLAQDTLQGGWLMVLCWWPMMLVLWQVLRLRRRGR